MPSTTPLLNRRVEQTDTSRTQHACRALFPATRWGVRQNTHIGLAAEWQHRSRVVASVPTSGVLLEGGARAVFARRTVVLPHALALTLTLPHRGSRCCGSHGCRGWCCACASRCCTRWQPPHRTAGDSRRRAWHGRYSARWDRHLRVLGTAARGSGCQTVAVRRVRAAGGRPLQGPCRRSHAR